MHATDYINVKSQRPAPPEVNHGFKKVVLDSEYRWRLIRERVWITRLVFFGYASILILVGAFLDSAMDRSWYVSFWFYLVGTLCAMAGVYSKKLHQLSLQPQQEHGRR